MSQLLLTPTGAIVFGEFHGQLLNGFSPVCCPPVLQNLCFNFAAYLPVKHCHCRINHSGNLPATLLNQRFDVGKEIVGVCWNGFIGFGEHLIFYILALWGGYFFFFAHILSLSFVPTVILAG
jgi:hypothetical protein